MKPVLSRMALAIFVALLTLPCPAPPALAASQDEGSSVKAAILSDEDRTDLARIEHYLNHLKSISADFLQIDDNGGIMRGSIALQRPGKMRVDYDPPSKDFIIADGKTVHIWNEDLKSQTNVDQGSSLAEFILRDPVKLSGDVVVTSVKHFPAKIEVTLVQKDDAGAGKLTLVFEDRPLKLRQWKVFDAQGHTTGVNLENVREDVSFAARTFYFVPPNFGSNPKSAAP